MSNAYKVDFLPTVEDRKKRKWYQSVDYPLDGQLIAQHLQKLIDERLHQGYRLVQIIDAHTSGGSSGTELATQAPRPNGLLVVFAR
jgi:(2Fe-2S) ferredoxin